MKNSILIGILLISMITSGAVYSVWAQSEVLLGVKEGDNFTYSFVVTWSSTNPNAIVPKVFADMNQTLSIHMNVTSARATMAILNITTTMRDGTQTSQPGYVEVSSGRYVGTALLIGANLTAGNQVYPLSEPAAVAAGVSAVPFTINETKTGTYLGIARTVNHYTESSTNATTGDTEQKDVYYDQATGVLMEMKLQFTSSSSGETASEQWKITQFNNAVGPSDGTNNDGTDGTTSNSLPSWLLPVVVAVVALVVIVLIATVVIRKRGKPKAQPSETSETPFN